MSQYDTVILGGGASGLSLALALAQRFNGQRSILLVEKETKVKNDRTWCYWTAENSPLDRIRYCAWDALRFTSTDADIRLALQPYRYQMIRSSDYYQSMQHELRQYPNVELRTEEAGSWQEEPDRVQVWVGGETVRAAWVFDSRLNPADLPQDSKKHHFLKQHFTGWEIETEDPVFDPSTATLFDLRTAQRGGLSFFYNLPFSTDKALIEYTIFSPELLQTGEYELALRGYIENQLGITRYRVKEVETGVIPMTDYPFRRRLGQRVMAIGSLGGQIKPSTGYAFSRIQRDAQSIADAIERHGSPFAIPTNSKRHRFFDALVLDVMLREPQQVRTIMTRMFTRNPIQRVFRFLDDQSSLGEDISLLASLPSGPFLRALRRYIYHP